VNTATIAALPPVSATISSLAGAVMSYQTELSGRPQLVGSSAAVVAPDASTVPSNGSPGTTVAWSKSSFAGGTFPVTLSVN